MLTTPLLPGDYLGLVNPLWSARRLRGRVEAVRAQTAASATLRIRPGRGWAGHRAGQYVGLGVEIDGVRHLRSFSLSAEQDAPGGCIEVTVKAVAGGHVSPHLVHRTVPGTVVDLEPAAGEFVLPGPAPERLLFLTAGSGITPVMAILRSLVRAGATPDCVVVHVDRRPADVIFGAELRALAAAGTLRLHEHHTLERGRPTPEALTARVPDWRVRSAWACGPGALLDRVRDHYAAAGLAARLRMERFQAASVPAGERHAGGRVTFARSGRETQADGATTLLAAGEAAGVLMPSGCRMGICRGCVAPLLGGEVRDLRTGRVHGRPGDHVQTCVSAAAGPVEIGL
jgi:stearoyl-CoA 9-desaturase NADPH oxidoreductase